MQMHSAKHTPNDGISYVPSAIADTEVVEMKKMTMLKVEAKDQSVVIIEEEEKEMQETIKAAENYKYAKGSTAQIVNNVVLRKLLRGPRYFDPPDSSWGACFNCGEEGHNAVKCSVVKKKPCFVCGGPGHSAKRCTKGQDCFICKKRGHRAKDCPEKHTSTSKCFAICLKCGNSGHDLFSCRNDYSPDDVKEIQCYVCKRLGHLCCINIDEATSVEISCYKCGQLGHTGLACSRLREEIASGATASSCFKCGEEGHFARECTSSIKSRKRDWESSQNKDKRSPKEIGYMGNRSAPNDLSEARRKKWFPAEERDFSTPKKSKSRGGWMAKHHAEERGFSTPKKSKSRGGWMTEHPSEQKDCRTPKKSKNRGGWAEEEFIHPMTTRSRSRFSGTTSCRNNKIHSFGCGSHTPSYKSSKVWNGHDGTSMAQGSAWSNHYKFSAPR